MWSIPLIIFLFVACSNSSELLVNAPKNETSAPIDAKTDSSITVSDSLQTVIDSIKEQQKNILEQREIIKAEIDSIKKLSEQNKYIVLNFEDSTLSYAQSSIEHITYKNKTFADFVAPMIKGQAAFNLEDTIFSVKSLGKANALTIDSSWAESFQFEQMRELRPHSNTVDVMDWNGSHYVYISEWNGEHRCFVESLHFNPEKKNWETKLKQTLKLDIPDSIRGSGNIDWIIDKENRMVYTQAYKDGSSRSATGLIFLQFRLPSPDEGDVVFKTVDVLNEYHRPMIKVTQDKKIYKKYMYIVSGAPESNYKRIITVFKLPELIVDKEIDISLIDEEPEGIFFSNDRLMMLYKKGIYHIQEKPALILYFKNGEERFFDLVNVKSIEFK